MRIGEALANVLDKCSSHRNQVLNRLLIQGGFGAEGDAQKCLAEAVAKTAESSRLFSIPVPDPAEFKATMENIAKEMEEFKNDVAAGGAITQSEQDNEGSMIPAGTPFAIIFASNATLVDETSRYLTAAGIWPLACTSAVEARYLADGAQAVLCDMTANVPEAVALLRNLRADGFQKPIVAVNENRSRTFIEGVIAAGISGFLPMQFTKGMLLEKLGLVLPANQQSGGTSSASFNPNGRVEAIKPTLQTLHANQ